MAKKQTPPVTPTLYVEVDAEGDVQSDYYTSLTEMTDSGGVELTAGTYVAIYELACVKKVSTALVEID